MSKPSQGHDLIGSFSGLLCHTSTPRLSCPRHTGPLHGPPVDLSTLMEQRLPVCCSLSSECSCLNILMALSLTPFRSLMECHSFICIPLSPLSASLWNISEVQFSCSVVSDSLRPHEPQHARPPCPSPTPGVHPNSCPLSQ